jgi:heme exporter protein A
MIQAQGLAKYYGRITALRDIRLEIPRGQFVALLGRNGAGKTTLLRILAGLTRPSAGTAAIAGLAPQAARGSVGYLAHSTALYMDLTAWENLRFYARLAGLGRAGADLEREIERVGLAGRAHEPVRHFSRGMQQRLAIARAFLHDPGIWLLDEPFTGLDQEGAQFLKGRLAGAHAAGRTILMAVHDIALGYELAQRFIVIEKGAVALDVMKTSMSLEELAGCFRQVAQGR